MRKKTEEHEKIRQMVADELREVAEELESDEIQLTETVRYTHVLGMYDELPAEIEITYYDSDYGGERTIEIY